MKPEDIRSVTWDLERGSYVATTELYPHLTAVHFDKDTALRRLARMIQDEKQKDGN